MDAVTLDIKKKKYAELVAKRKVLKKRLKIGGAVLAVLSVLIYLGLQPLKGKMEYGLCRTYVELTLKYPPTLQISEVAEFDKAMRVYYTYIDPFGQYRKDMAECMFKTNEYGQLYIADLKINRIPEPQDRIAKFNATIPIVVAQKPDLVIPVYDDVLKNVVVTPPPAQ